MAVGGGRLAPPGRKAQPVPGLALAEPPAKRMGQQGASLPHGFPTKALATPWDVGDQGPPKEEERLFSKTPRLPASAFPERGPGLGTQCLGFRPSLDLDLLSEEGNPPNPCGPQFPPPYYPWRPSQP